MKRTRLALATLALVATSCSTAGPFVTSISSDGRGGLIIEKSMVTYNSFTGTVSNENTTTTTIKLTDISRSEEPSRSAPREIGGR